MINLVNFQKSFYLRWAELLLQNKEEDWKCLAYIVFKNIGGTIAFESNLKSKAFQGINRIKNSFWKQVLIDWLNSKPDDSSILSPESPIFNNKNIKYKNKTLFFPQVLKIGMTKIKHFFTNDCIIPFTVFKERLSSPDCLLLYNCIFNALNTCKNKIVFDNYNDTLSSNSPSITYHEVEVRKIGRKQFYNILNSNQEPAVEHIWKKRLNIEFFNQYWLVAFNSTKETILQALHWKILMKMYPTSALLYKIKIKQSDLCPTCHEVDTLDHFFFSCSRLNHFLVKSFRHNKFPYRKTGQYQCRYSYFLVF